MMHNFLDIFLGIKHLLLDLGLGRLLWGRISRIEQRDDMHLANNNLVQKDIKKKYQRRGLARTAWLIIDPKMVSRELMSPAKLMETQAFCISEPSEV